VAPILVCEEDRDARLAIVDLLLSAGYQVQVAVDARQALYAALSCPASCVILSLPLSGGEPEEIFRSLRGVEEERALPIVIIAHARLLPLSIPGFRHGIDQRLSPALRPADLLASVGNAIAASRASFATR
jgi:DNA-binding response OmpR family regulator